MYLKMSATIDFKILISTIRYINGLKIWDLGNKISVKLVRIFTSSCNGFFNKVEINKIDLTLYLFYS